MIRNHRPQMAYEKGLPPSIVTWQNIPRDKLKKLYISSQDLLLSNLTNSWLLRYVLHMLLWGSKKVIPLLKFFLKINYLLNLLFEK